MVIILDLCMFFMIFFSALFYAGMFYDVVYDETYILVVASTLVLFSDLAYASIGVGYLIIGRSHPIAFSNKVLAFITIPLQTLPSIKMAYEPFTGPVSDNAVGWIGLGISVALMAWSLFETKRDWKNYHVYEGQNEEQNALA